MYFKKLISVFLALTLVFGIVTISLSASAEKTEYPTVYVVGQGCHLTKEAGNPNSETIYPINLEQEYISDTIKDLNPVFLKGLITGDYDDYCDVIYNAVEAKFRPILLDKNGEASDGSGVYWSWSLEDLTDTAESDGGHYGLFDYMFQYDWRLDPCETAKKLDAYINDVMTVTGASKVNIVSRCLGCNIVAAYLVDFGYETVNKCVLYCSAAEGIDLCNETFSGQIYVDADSAERFAYDKLGDDTIMEFVKASLSLLNKTYGLDLLTGFVNTIYQKVAENIVPRLLRVTYGAMPSYLSMTCAEYEQIKETVFGGYESEYEGTIAKADNFHYNVQAKLRQVLEKADETVDFMVIGKYGCQFLPIIKSSNEISDGWLEVTSATFGATVVPSISDTFDDEYINKAKENGTFKYISPDSQIDASTCLFPDYTWIIKGIEHRDFPESINSLICEFLAFDGQMTVLDDTKYPQYLVYNGEEDTITPMTEENNDVTEWNEESGFALLFKVASMVVPVIIELIKTAASKAE